MNPFRHAHAIVCHNATIVPQSMPIQYRGLSSLASLLLIVVPCGISSAQHPQGAKTPAAEVVKPAKPAEQSKPAERRKTLEPAKNADGTLRLPLNGRDGHELLLRNFRPESKLRVAENPRNHAKFPVVDVHTHFHYRLRGNEQALADFVALMDRNRIAVCASLDGKLGGQLERHMKFLWPKYRDRFVIYANIDWRGDAAEDDPTTWQCHRQGFAERTAKQLATAVEQGVSGLKIFKRFGLKYRNPDGSLIQIDDPRWDPIWKQCGDLSIPVIIHTADPAAFFDPIDETNERWEELSRHPEWSFHGDEFPSRQELLDARNRVIKRHPKTQFIGAHIANNSEDLASVSAWLDEYPNLWIEPASRIAELGRQPFTSRDFLIKYADRLLFGTDGPWPEPVCGSTGDSLKHATNRFRTAKRFRHLRDFGRFTASTCPTMCSANCTSRTQLN